MIEYEITSKPEAVAAWEVPIFGSMDRRRKSD
jgi:hypothetical protein